ncbi:GNAT family N-acetyltransferase [Streptomyces sp. TRM66268-LWL]|uniref:GNAT family N-acetyltransferase n=1 Tax=Streptomyces polyasparticus TaxID=2767826 RepID=A0ABR7SUA7_9ACTN|nr:GNAT family N-acetyltransferase [Streptomyces polyasparticus]MBC9718121.1 GNAT family N-acetyltransferase [Streptomyces polyasparticus]
MTLDIRTLEPGDWDRWFSALELAFGGVREAPQEREFDQSVTETERSIGVWDGDRVVGTAGAFSFRLAVPGGALVPAAGVTMVSVAPTHRRRGILTSMMRRQLDDVRALGEPLAVLTASEPEIYGRFGYGIATLQLGAEIDSTRVRLAAPAGTDDVRLHLVDGKETLERCEELYARLVPQRPGMLARLETWKPGFLVDPPEDREGASPLQCLLAERDGELVGYARFRTKPDWDSAGPRGTVKVQHMDAVDAAAQTAMLRHFLSMDLMAKVELRNRPVDDAWQHLVSDIRRCDLRLRDSLHLRPVEVGAALEARTYRTPVDVVFEVSDPFCPWNEGRWRLTGDSLGASCKRTEDAADLSLSVRELGAAYLGGFTLTALAAAGRVRELRAGALASASLAFGSDVAPWLPHGF